MENSSKIFLLASAAIVFAPAIALAQTAPAPAAAPAAASSTAVQEIVVTSTRRAVDLQKVAGTVTALPAETLKAMNITSSLQLQDLTPGLQVSPSGGNTLYLRGIGAPSTGYNEAQVAMYIDGVYLAYPGEDIFSFNNIDQIEVLKGPQGTLYGRNATGGLISVTTHDPSMSGQKLDASVGVANYNTVSESFYGSTPIGDKAAINLSIYNSKQSQGWSTNIFNGTTEQKSQETGIQSKLVWHPTSDTKVTTNFIYDTNNRDIGYAYEVYPGTVANDGTPYNGKYKADSRVDPSSPYKSYLGSLKIEQDLGFAKFMSLTAYQTSTMDTTFSPAGGPGQALVSPTGVVTIENAAVDYFIQDNKTWSQEFQLASTASASRLDWMAGAFLYKDNLQLDLQSWDTCVANVCGGSPPTNINGLPTTTSYSGYADANYRIFDATHLTVGLRYTDETKTLGGTETPLAGFPNSVATLPVTTVTYPGQTVLPNGATPAIIIPTSLHFDKLTYRIVLAQDFGENIHAYISDNLGFKSGAFNGDLFTNPPALPETLQAYEVGVKSELFDRRLRLNASYFYYDYTNVQVRSISGAPLGNSFLENAARENQKGVDVDFNFVVTPQFSINGGYEYLRSIYTSFPGTSCSTYNTKVVDGVTVAAITSATCNLAGYQTPFSPQGSGNIGFIYKVDSKYGTWALSGNDTYNTSYPMEATDIVIQKAHHILDASLLWTAPHKNFDVRLWARNLSAEYTYVVAFANGGGSDYVTPGAPRTFGVTLGYHY